MPEHCEKWVKASYVSAAFKSAGKRVPHGYTDALSEFVREVVALSVQTGAAPEIVAKTVPVQPPLTGAAVQAAIAKRAAGEHVPDILTEAKRIQEGTNAAAE